MKRLFVVIVLLVPAASHGLALRVISPAPVRVILQRADVKGAPVERTLSAGAAIVDLPNGAWRIDASAPGMWHAVQFVTTPTAGPVDIRMWPAATIAGEVAISDGEPPPEQLSVRFTVSDGASGDAICRVTAKRFGCSIPAGTADLALRIRGHVTRYVWSAVLVPGATHDLGRLAFIRGATLAGRVECPRGVKVTLDSVTVTAAPAGARQEARVSTLSTHPNLKGFFHIDGIAPGEYDVVAGAPRPRVSSSPVRARVMAGAEATLSRPLVMSAPRALTITIDPPIDPSAKQWRIQIAEQRSPKYYEPVADALVPLGGAYRTQPLHSGHYSIIVGAQDNSAWNTQEIEIDENTPDVFIPLHLTRLHGSVHLGDKPLEGTIWIGGEHGDPRIELHSTESGSFDGFIPEREGQTWPVTVQSEVPAAKRNFPAVRLRRRADDSLETDLRLDLTMLQGDVVDDKGAPVAHAKLNVTALDGEFDFVQPNSGDDGRFAVYGLRPGRYRIAAMHYMRESKPVDVDIRADEEPPLLRLVLLPNRQLSGFVQSDAGPVAGARITAWAADVPNDVVHTFTTNEAGAFSALIPPAAQQIDVLVESPGFAVKMFRIPYDSRAVIIHVQQSGGTLDVEGIPAIAAVIQHSGATLPLMALTYLEGSSTADKHSAIAMLEPGNYTVCASGGAGCASGFLPPFGTLKLDLTEASTKRTN